MAVLQIRKITGSLPNPLSPSTMYLVNNNNVLSVYVTDKTGTEAIPLNTSSLSQADLLAIMHFFQSEFVLQNTQGVIVPFYTASISNGTWTAEMSALVDLIQSYHDVRYVVILKLGQFSDNRAIDRLKFAGATVLGYVDGDLGSRTAGALMLSIDTLKSAYPGIDGVFLDNITTATDKSADYGTVTEEVHKLGMALSVLNTRQNVPTSYFTAADVVVSYYGQNYPADTYYNGAMVDSPATQPYAKRAAMVFNAIYDAKKTAALLKTNSLIYVTDGMDDFSHVSAYVDDMADTISRVYKPVHIPNISGPLTLYTGQTGNYTITNFDSTVAYTVSASAGTIGILNDQIAFTVPNTPGTATFSVNGKEITVSIISSAVKQPYLIAPVDDSTDIPSSLTLLSSVFDTAGTIDNHLETDWQISTSPVFATLFLDKVGTDIERKQITVINLDANTVYYARIRHRGTVLGYSGWSPVVKFTTRGIFFPVSEIRKLTASNKASGDLFGRATAVSELGTTIAVGAYMADISCCTNVGETYVYSTQGGAMVEKADLSHSGGADNDYGGFSIDINKAGTILVIGAYHKDVGTKSAAGQAYIFGLVNGIWTQQALLSPSDLAAGDNFGWSVAIDGDGDTVIIGAPAEDPSGLSNAGSAYVFTQTNGAWTQQAKLLAADRATGDSFGRAVSISENGLRAIVGAPEADSNGISNCGKVYIFNRSGTVWSQLPPLLSDILGNNDYLGYAVDISADGNYAIAGAYNAVGSGYANAGYAIIYNLTGASPVVEAHLVASDAAVSDNFGFSVALDGTGRCALVGSPNADIAGLANTGAAYVYTRTGTQWEERIKLSASDKKANDYYGASVSISKNGTTAVIGAYNSDPSSVSNAGAAYVYM